MPKINITLLNRNNKYLELLATVLDTTKSQVMNDILAEIDADNLESTFWEEWEEAFLEYQEFILSVGSSEEESEEEEEEEEEE